MRNTSETLEESADFLHVDRSGVMVPHKELVDAAALAIAKLFDHGDWPDGVRSLVEYEYIEDGSVPLRAVLNELEYRRHALQVASWAVYELLERDLLLGRSRVPSFQYSSSDCPDPRLFMSYTDTVHDEAGGELIILPLIRPGPLLSRWRNLSPGARPTLSKSETTGESRNKEVEQEHLSVPAGHYVLEKVNNRTIRVCFGEEQGSMTGRGAFRVYKLICQGRIHVLELAGDIEALEERRSAVPYEEMAGFDEEGHADFGAPSRDTGLKECLKKCWDQLKGLNCDIEASDSELERQELKQKKDQILQHVKKFARVEPSTISKARARADRGFRRTIDDLSDPMPRFAHHLRVSRDYDQVHDQYVYSPAQQLLWEFKGFQ